MEQEKTRNGRETIIISESVIHEFDEIIVEAIREPLILLDQDLRVIFANRSFYRVFKVNPKETIGKFIYDLGNKQLDIPKLRELLQVILQQKTAFDNFEVEHDFATIGKRVMILNARQIQKVSGKEQIILLAIEDITDRKLLEDLLTESEERYRRLFETASDGIVLLEKSEGEITHANPATEKILGYNKKESVGSKLRNIGVSLDMDDFRTTMQKLNKSGIVYYNDVPAKTKSGQHIVTDIYLVDKAILVQCNIRDITDRKRNEEALYKSEVRYRSIFENAVEGIFQSTPDGRFLSVNPAMARMLGYDSPDELISSVTNIGEQLYANPEERLAAIKELKENDIVKGIELQHRRKDGSLFWILANVRAAKDEKGNILYLEGTYEDITARKLSEEKLRKILAGTIHAMSLTIETRDPYTAGHQKRVSNLARAIAQEMNLTGDTIDNIRMAGIIHDIGKISVPAEILSRPGKLSDTEFSLIKVHPQTGYDILKDAELPYPIAEIVLQHHERLDGSGYPQGLRGDQIFLEAKILAVADLVEAITTHRPYRPALGIDAALEEIEKNKDILYDENVVEVCLKLFGEKGFVFE